MMTDRDYRRQLIMHERNQRWIDALVKQEVADTEYFESFKLGYGEHRTIPNYDERDLMEFTDFIEERVFDCGTCSHADSYAFKRIL